MNQTKYGRCATCASGVTHVATKGCRAFRLCERCMKRLAMWGGRTRRGWKVVELHGPGGKA